MRKLFQIAIVMAVATDIAEAQIPPSMTYDSLSGDWIITYQGSEGPIEAYFVPATKIYPTVKASIEKTGDTLLYQYTLTNGALSRQRLLNFRLSFRGSVFNVTHPNFQWDSRTDNLVHGWYWGHTLVNPDGGPSSDMGIPADSSVGGFSIQSFGLPAIVNCYFQGLTGTVTFVESPPKEVYDLIRPLRVFPTNEVLRTTVATADPPTPFNDLNFLDTLISHTTRSRALNWILDQSTANKYTGLFTRAKSDLQAANVPTARSRLDTVLQQVRVDSVASLTSEAYALLRFNTEYLDTVLARTTMVNYPANWNLVSVPRVTSTFKGTELFPTLWPGALYGYNGSYYLVDTLQNGVGYWAGLSQATSVSFTGSTLTQTSRTVPGEGWWFAGSISKSVPLANLTSNPPGLIVVVYGWENQYVIPTQLEPGKGYWVRVTGACTLNITQ